MEEKKPTILAMVIGIIVLVLLVISVIPFFGAWQIVGAGHVGVVTRFGAVQRTVEPGIIFKVPIFEGVHSMETRTQKEQVDAAAASKDLQEVKSTIALNYHLDGLKAKEVYQQIGTNYRERIIDPAMQEAFKATTAKFTAEELITQREAIKKEAFQLLKWRLEPNHIVVDEFNIVNFDFSESFNAAIEQKQVAQQNVEREKRNLERIAVEADQRRTEAKGVADAQRTLKESGSLSPEYLQYLAVTKWNGQVPLVTGGGGTPLINIPNK